MKIEFSKDDFGMGDFEFEQLMEFAEDNLDLRMMLAQVIKREYDAYETFGHDIQDFRE